MPIRILVTGGTFDKKYDVVSGKLKFDETNISEILNLGRCTVDYTLRTLMMIDSLEMTDSDREIILNSIKSSPENEIIVTHGTDTMVETAEFLAKCNLDKTIVITGAMMPYKFGASDALFNFGGAMAYVQLLSAGVYVVMNGKYYNWDSVIKNKKTGFFEDIISK